MDKKQDLTARNFPTAEEDAEAAVEPSRYAGPESAYRLAFTDTEFLLREELRPVRMQLELLKPELVQREHGIEATIVIFGSARILPPEAAQERLAAPEASGDPRRVGQRPRMRDLRRALPRRDQDCGRDAALLLQPRVCRALRWRGKGMRQ